MAKKRSTKAKKKNTTKRQRMTPNQAAFAKQQQRIKRFIKSAEKRGYSFPANAVPERPARVTKRDISRITAIKPETLYQQATFSYDGSTFTGTEGRMIERSLAAQKGALHKCEKDPRYHTKAGSPPAEATDVADRLGEVIDRIADTGYKINQGTAVYNAAQQEIDSWSGSPYWNEWFTQRRYEEVERMQRMIQSSIRTYGFGGAMKAIGTQAEDFARAVDIICYDSNQERIRVAFNTLAEILKGSALTAEEGADMDVLMDATVGYSPDWYDEGE